MVLSVASIAATTKIATLTVRMVKDTDTTNALAFYEGDTTRGIVLTAITVLLPNEAIKIESYYPATFNDPRNVFSACVLSIL